MSSVTHNTKAPSAGREHRNSSGQAQGHTYDQSKAYQDIPSSAHEYHQQKRKEPGQGDKNSGNGEIASTLTSQAMTQFEQLPQNNLQALDDRVTEYRKSSPVPCEHKKSPKGQRKQMADSMNAWSDKWERLERE